MINTRYPYPFFPVTGKVLTSGQFGDLKSLNGAISVGLFDSQTYGIATATGNGSRFFIGYSSEHTKDFIDKWHFGNTNGRKGHEFRGKDLISFEFSRPTKKSAEKWTIGWTGSSGCNEKVMEFECGRTYGIRINTGGSPVWRRWAKTTQHEVFITTPCCDSDECATGCPDNKISSTLVIKQLAKAINSHIELQRLGVKAYWRANTYSVTATSVVDYCMSVCDSGDSYALGQVQTQVGALGQVARTDREGGVSTYKVSCVGSSPAAFTPFAYAIVPDCPGSAPVGYTLQAAASVFNVIRPLGGTENLVNSTVQNAYADPIGVAYGATATNTKFISQNGSTATIEFTLAAGAATPAALLADTIVKLADRPAMYIPTAPSTVAWTACGTAYKVQRNLCMTLNRKECGGANWLAEMTAYYANDPSVVAGSLAVVAGTDCADSYTISQWSGCMNDICLAGDTAEFPELNGFKGTIWSVVEPAAPAYASTDRVGLEVSADIPEEFFSDCSMELGDYVETDPIRLEISWIENQLTGLAAVCDKNFPIAKKKKAGTYDRQKGEYILRTFLKAGTYLHNAEDIESPRLREILDMNRRAMVDRNAYYNIYYIQYKTNHGNDNNFDEKSLVDEAMICFKEGDPKEAQFIAAFSPVLAKFGVYLQERK
jgi:hypothetical protein